MKQLLVIILAMTFCLGVGMSALALDERGKLNLRYDWLWGWQFKFEKEEHWRNVGLFCNDLKGALADYPEAVNEVNKAVLWRRGLDLAATALLVFLPGRFAFDEGITLDTAGLVLRILILKGSNIAGQILQGDSLTKAVRIYNQSLKAPAH